MKIKLSILLILSCGISYAGVKGLTWHSRANCMKINESITWQLGVPHWLNTTANHYKGSQRPKCHEATGWTNTWRSAVVHWTEGNGGWEVIGDHWLIDPADGQEKYLGKTVVKDCSIYDGWWDQDDPRKKITATKENKIETTGHLYTSGIHIVPESELGYPDVLLTDLKRKQSQFMAKGYVEKSSYQATELLKMATPSYQFTDNLSDPYDTDIKHNLSSIRLAFSFNGIGHVDQTKVIGYAPGGTFIPGKGWTSIGEYYKTDTGICHYLKEDVSLTQGGVTLAKEKVSYDVNDKPTTYYVEGNADSGYLYNLQWFDERYFQTLECVSSNLISNKKTSLIEQAKIIDKQS
jgi:hypothetical protein